MSRTLQPLLSRGRVQGGVVIYFGQWDGHRHQVGRDFGVPPTPLETPVPGWERAQASLVEDGRPHGERPHHLSCPLMPLKTKLH